MVIKSVVWPSRVVSVATHLFSGGVYSKDVVYVLGRDSFVVGAVVGWKGGCHSRNSQPTSLFGEKFDGAVGSMLRVVWTNAL